MEEPWSGREHPRILVVLGECEDVMLESVVVGGGGESGAAIEVWEKERSTTSKPTEEKEGSIEAIKSPKMSLQVEHCIYGLLLRYCYNAEMIINDIEVRPTRADARRKLLHANSNFKLYSQRYISKQ